MESSVDDHEVHQSFKSPPRRRRSTFFEKRDSIVPLPLTETIDLNVNNKLSKMDEKHNQDLMRYHDILVAEKDQWKAEVKYRRSKYYDLRQQFQIEAKAQSRSRISYSSLSNEDIDFLKRKINLSQLCESQLNLHKSIKQTRALYRRAIELDNVVLNHCEKKLNQVTDYLLKNSTVDLKD